MIEGYFVLYHAAILVDSLFEITSRADYMELKEEDRLEQIAEIITEYCSINDIVTRDDLSKVEAELTVFLHALIEEEQRYKNKRCH